MVQFIIFWVKTRLKMQNFQNKIMTKEDNDKIADVVSEEFIDSEEWKENLLKQGKWLRLLWMIGFSFIYYLSMTVLWIIVLIQFLFVLLTDKRSSNVTKVSMGFRNYMVQILDYINYHSSEKPFPFSDFPNSEEEKQESINEGLQR